MESMFTGFIGLIFGLFIIVCIFILCRELMCWYWKINKSIENQDKIIFLLERLVNKQSTTPIQNGVDINTVTGYEGYIGQQVEVIQKNGLKLTGEVVASDAPEEFLALFTSGNILKIKLDFIKEVKIRN